MNYSERNFSMHMTLARRLLSRDIKPENGKPPLNPKNSKLEHDHVSENHFTRKAHDDAGWPRRRSHAMPYPLLATMLK